MLEPLSDEWIERWRAEVTRTNGSVSGGDPWSLLLRFRADASGFLSRDREVHVELEGSRVVGLSSGRRSDEPEFVITAPAATWKDVFDGRRDPVTSIMFGHLALEKGSVGRLAPHVSTARRLLEAAKSVPTKELPGAARAGE